MSVSIPVADQDRALEFYTGVLGCDVRMDTEVWPGARVVEVVPPGTDVGLLLLPPDSDVPLAVRMGTTDADEAHRVLGASGVSTDDVLRLDGVPPMFAFTDPDGNGLVYLEGDDTDTASAR